MSNRADNLRDQLNELTQLYSNKFRNELVSVEGITRSQRYLNLIIFFIVVSASLGLVSIIIIRSITRPLQKAAALAGAMANGDLSHKLDVHQKDEIGELAQAMNIMAEKIEESHSGLEQKLAIINNILDIAKIEAGMNDFISKPLKQSKLFSVLSKYGG